MIDTIHIFEDIISKENQDILEEYFLNKTVGWKHINNTVFDGIYLPQDVLIPKNINNEKIKSIISEIENNVIGKIDNTFQANYRYKVNLLKSTNYLHERNDMDSIHIDRDNPHISIVYYINDSDGDTKFYKINNGNISEWQNYVSNRNYKKFSEIKSVSPKKGKVVVFNGMIPHHSTYPKIGNRYVINFNTAIKPTPTSAI